MSNFRPREERFPLLLYFVENDKEFSSTNKRFFSEKVVINESMMVLLEFSVNGPVRQY